MGIDKKDEGWEGYIISQISLKIVLGNMLPCWMETIIGWIRISFKSRLIFLKKILTVLRATIGTNMQ